MPRSAAGRRLEIEPRSWSSPWTAQLVRGCTACRRRRPIMLIENDAFVCTECHDDRLRQWRLDDEAAERTEALWSVWDLVAGGSTR